MSIANVEDMTEDRTALDDWESLLYVICWLATFGIKSSNRIAVIENSEYPITSWSAGTATAIALAKRTHMDNIKSLGNNITNKFQGRYKLLKNLAANLHEALFLNEGCLGALRSLSTSNEDTTKPNAGDSDISDSDDSDEDTESSGEEEAAASYDLDPLVERCKYMDSIVDKLLGIMDSMKAEAERRLSKKAAVKERRSREKAADKKHLA
ncbi:hypothetical protein LPJ78_005615 [Coemansia sp. RSA 989]|nr:hypothetical protein LPJ78_005615 [Coemansia sp. RSA 989]